MRRWALYLICGVVPGCQCSKPEGDSVATSPYSLSILEVTPCPASPEVDTGRVRLVGVKVRIVGHHPRGVPANYFYASLLTTDQNRYLADYAGCSPRLSGKPLAPGEAAEGYLNFPVPVGKVPDKLVYAAALGGQHEGSSTVELRLANASPVATNAEER